MAGAISAQAYLTVALHKQVTIRGVALRTPSWELLHDLPWYKNASFKGTRGPEDVLRMRAKTD